MTAGTEHETATKVKETSVGTSTDDIYSRPANLTDLRHTQDIVSLLNKTFARDGEHFTYESIQEIIRDTAKETNKVALFLCFGTVTDKHKQERKEDEIVVGTAIIYGQGYKYPGYAIRNDAAAGGYDQHIHSDECFGDLFAVRPEYHSKGAATSLLVTGSLHAKHRMGYKSMVTTAFETNAMVIAWFRRCGARIIGIMKHPNPQWVQDRDSVYLLFKVDFDNMGKHKL